MKKWVLVLSLIKKTHKEFYYNCLVKISKHERNIERTTYLIRDWWSLNQLKDLKEFLDNEIEDREIENED